MKVERKKIELLEDESFYDDDSSVLPPADIVAYNELRSCADLFRMYTQKILDIQPEFQRDICWTPAAQTRFIDSLIKQLPIPSMCFSYDAKQQKWMVIDGLQRISTIVKFLEGGDWHLSTLDDIDSELIGKSVAEIKLPESTLHGYYTRIENLTIPITVLRCDYSRKEHLKFLFTVFHRLNTGGMRLNNQEIRNCIYAGLFNQLLRDLDELESWRKINCMKPDESYRFTKQELILRFFAFYEKHSDYTGSLSNFLNDYMKDNQKIEEQRKDQFRDIFTRTSDFVYEKILDKKVPNKFSITILEAIFVGVAKNLNQLDQKGKRGVKKMYSFLINHKEFSEAALAEGLSKKQKVIDRLNAAIKIFSGK
jgi:hypothetical protein